MYIPLSFRAVVPNSAVSRVATYFSALTYSALPILLSLGMPLISSIQMSGHFFAEESKRTLSFCILNFLIALRRNFSSEIEIGLRGFLASLTIENLLGLISRIVYPGMRANFSAFNVSVASLRDTPLGHSTFLDVDVYEVCG